MQRRRAACIWQWSGEWGWCCCRMWDIDSLVRLKLGSSAVSHQQNDSSATVEATQPTLWNHPHVFLQLLSLRCRPRPVKTFRTALLTITRRTRVQVKEQSVGLGKKCEINNLSLNNWVNKLTNKHNLYSFTAFFLASNSVQGPYFLLRTALVKKMH